MLTRAITRRPGRDYAEGLTTAGLGPPDHAQMLAQHAAYVGALRGAGLDVLVLGALEGFPDACFVEDAAVVTPEFAVLARPGAASRRGEEAAIEPVLTGLRPVERIEAPGTLDGGDVLQAGSHYFIGISQRTNAEGARQLAALLARYGCTSAAVQVAAGLHLKSSVNHLGEDRLIVSEAFAGLAEWRPYELLVVDREEEYACNTLHVNGHLLLPSGHPRTRRRLEELQFPITELDVSEARKMDAGLSCLSIRY